MTNRSDGIADRHLVAIIDGNAVHRRELIAALRPLYRVTAYADGLEALAALPRDRPAALIVGRALPPLSGFETALRLRLARARQPIPLLLILDRPSPAAHQTAEAFAANDHLVKPYRRSRLILALSSLCNAAVESRWQALPPRQRRALTTTLGVFNGISEVIDRGEPIPYAAVGEACGALIDAVNNADVRGILAGVKDHDNYSYVHCLRVATLLSLFGHAMGLAPAEQAVLAGGGLLHDVGKMAIPYEVLNKPGRLNDPEMQVMRGHVEATIRYLRAASDLPRGVLTIAAQHHERLDASGYPHGLKGRQLNNLARMAAIVDVFSALTDRRAYKPAIEAEQVLAMMRDDMRGHLDPHLLRLFREVLLDGTREG